MTQPQSASPDQEGRPALPQLHPLPSRRRRIALAVTVTAFFLWIGYLAFLASTASRPSVLSRPQILVSNLIVIAQLSGSQHPDPPAIVLEVPWAGDKAAQPRLKDKITVSNLEQVYAADAGHPKGSWRGPGPSCPRPRPTMPRWIWPVG